MLSEPLIAEKIKRYLCKHPNAADTLDGVVQWWLQYPQEGCSDGLMARDYHLFKAQVQIVLDQLCKQGTLLCQTLPQGEFIYFRRPDNFDTSHSGS